MTFFAAFSDILPDPINVIGRAGQVDPAGTPGAGFASVKLTSSDRLLTTRVGSGRREVRAASYHSWMIDISYHPMTREEFDPVYSFLLHRKTLMQPFYVSLPQYASQTTTGVASLGAHIKDSVTLNVTSTVDTEVPQIFTIGAASKVYMITRSETTTDFYAYNPQPAIGEERYHITPGLANAVASPTALDFATPWFYVQQSGDNTGYTIDANNLYKFSLKLEEVPKNA